MKRFDELTVDQQERAFNVHLTSLLNGIIEGAIRFDDKSNNDNLQGRIDAAIAKAKSMRTPWFAHEYIMDTCDGYIRGMAQCDVEGSLYPEPYERIIEGIA